MGNDERDAMKRTMGAEKKELRIRKEQKRKQKLAEWQVKMKRSPFRVDLLAENERIDEENKVRITEESRRERQLSKQKRNVKNEIILKALSETSDLDALRAEKRAIQMEEKRLKALLDLEKTNSHRKQDQLAAARAEKQRKQTIQEHSRTQRIAAGREVDRVQRELLRAKLNVSTKQEAFAR